MEEKKRRACRIVWQIVLSLLCVASVAWIFSNSLTPAGQSAEQSAGATDALLKIIRIFYPDVSSLTEEQYEKIHSAIRVLAHFAEFAYLGAMFVWCWRAYSQNRAWLALPCGGVLLIPIVDELLQSFTDGRAMEWKDLAIDWVGGMVGGAFALGVLAFIAWIKIKRGKRNGKGELGNSTR